MESVHDIFDSLGVPDDAGAHEIWRASRRCKSPSHPDFEPPVEPGSAGRDRQFGESDDVAIDFANMALVVGRMRAAFFSVSA